MAGAFATITILDYAGSQKAMRVWDESGAGTGPFTFASDVPSIDGSGTITAGGTAQNLFGGATPAHGFFVVNLDQAETLWISLSTTAGQFTVGSIPLAPMGGPFITPPGMVPPGAVSIYAGTTGHKFTAVRW